MRSNEDYAMEDRAVSQDTSAEELRLLATNGQWQVRWHVAYNKNTDAETLSVLARDPEENVRGTAANNPNMRLDDLMAMMSDSSYYVLNIATRALSNRGSILDELLGE